MDGLLNDLSKLERNGGLADSISDVQKLQALLIEARENIYSGKVDQISLDVLTRLDPSATPTALAKLQNPAKQRFDDLNGDLKKIHKSLNEFSKALDKRFKDKPLPAVNQAALDHELIKRAIGMHFLREGEFDVAQAFADDVQKQNKHDNNILSPHLLEAFKEMYDILGEMQAKNLRPALIWARKHSLLLEARGSDLEFEISRLQFVWLFMSNLPNSLRDALIYAQQEFGGFQSRYQREIHELAAAMAFSPNLADSPYKRIFYNENAWEELGQSFTKEFCSLLGLSADSPMYIAVTAGAIALPVLQKYQSIVQLKRTEWTTEDELPVEIPLPRNYRFHSIFVCPVSKEQTTDENPPVMMPCGHVVAQNSLDMISKSIRFKCPYCPCESKPADARKVIL